MSMRPRHDFGADRVYRYGNGQEGLAGHAMPIRPVLPALAALAALVSLFLIVAPAAAQDAAELLVRLSRMETQMRQLSGQVEKLQFDNGRLNEQLQRFQKDVDLRFQDAGASRPPPAAPSTTGRTPPATTPPATAPPAQRRSDAFDPSAAPDAPGSPRLLGATPPSAPLVAGSGAGNGSGGAGTSSGGVVSAPPIPRVAAAPPIPSGPIEGIIDDDDEEGGIGAPLPRRAPSPPLDLSGVANAPARPGVPSGVVASLPPQGSTGAAPSPSVSATGGARADYDLAYSHILRQEYEAAETAMRAFIQAHPRSNLQPDATYWLGESYYQRGQYREAAEQYLAVSTKHASANKAPDALLKLGMSLNAIGAREQACSTYREIDRKYPAATAGVKRGIERETKRSRCTA